MLNAIKRYYNPPSAGQRSSRILATLFLLSAVSLGVSEGDFPSAAMFTALSFSFISLGVLANDHINKVVMWLSTAGVIISCVYLVYSNLS
jgi:hypothetical protein